MPFVIEKELCPAMLEIGRGMAEEVGKHADVVQPVPDSFLLKGATISEVARAEACLRLLYPEQRKILAHGEWEDVVRVMKEKFNVEERVIVGLVLGDLWGDVANQTAPTPPEIKDEQPDIFAETYEFVMDADNCDHHESFVCSSCGETFAGVPSNQAGECRECAG